MDSVSIVSIVTFFATIFLGFLSKKSKFISNNFIPLQNLFVGLVVAVIEWIITKDFSYAIVLSGFIAGGTYDIAHNLNIIIKGVD